MSSHPSLFFLPEQTADNLEQIEGIEQKAQSLYGLLAIPVRGDDHAEKGRRSELQRFVLVLTHINIFIPLSGGSMELLRSLN